MWTADIILQLSLWFLVKKLVSHHIKLQECNKLQRYHFVKNKHSLYNNLKQSRRIYIKSISLFSSSQECKKMKILKVRKCILSKFVRSEIHWTLKLQIWLKLQKIASDTKYQWAVDLFKFKKKLANLSLFSRRASNKWIEFHLIQVNRRSLIKEVVRPKTLQEDHQLVLFIWKRDPIVPNIRSKKFKIRYLSTMLFSWRIVCKKKVILRSLKFWSAQNVKLKKSYRLI